MKISIIGAGIGGLTLGNILKQQNLYFTIYESAPEIKPVGAGIMMAVNAMQIFEKLDLKEKIENAGNKIHGIFITDEKLKTISTTNVLALEKKYNSCNVAIYRSDLQNILAENLGFENIKLDYNLNKIDKKKNYHLKFENGSEIESRIVFGADGIHSKVRNQILESGIIRNAGQKCWRGLVDFDLPEQYFHHALEIWGKGKRFGFVKLSENRVYWYALINDKNFTENIDLTETLRDFDPLVLQILEATKPENIILNDIIDLAPIPKWFSENLCLIGDAAHATTPNMGQGACQSIEDAYVIGKLLEKNKDFNSVFKEFQKIRRKKVDYIVDTSWKIGKLSHWENGNSIRNFLMRSVPESINQKMIEKILQLEM
ncbi:FAD-dependent monooxygenase [Chryseobacterium chendengshani]|uniref:FAD-dependent monooxygenase n=1 Tax=Chryseobacterium sp. LJ668 TaxID=2864040 RepID=UPI001C68BC31|nr:FAD-dependent monooxygenase [Chryseobacterium sp. LJ668]MBW8522635.1 FAD-dependent monooxygenase [Chryseobacterium sp. LJ668]QYK16172.1 FAD-dependent monooxygenase [Chryseobacterium sp. LJ668]